MLSISPSTVAPLHPTTTTPRQTHYLQPEKLALLIDETKSIKHLRQMHAFVIRHGLESHPVLNFKLLRSFSSLGHLKHSVSLFRRTQNPNVYLYTALIHGHAINDLHEQAFLFYLQMLSEDVEPTAYTLSAVLKACPLETGKAFHAQVIKLGHDSDTYVRTSLLDVYTKGGDVTSARILFDTMPEQNLVSLTAMITGYAKNGYLDEARVLFDGLVERDVVSWNVMIDGYAQNGRPNDTLILFRQMLKAKVKPNEATLLAVLSACGQVGALESGRWIHSHMQRKGIFIDARMGSALVDMYSKCGSLEDAITVFNGIKEKDVVPFNAMIVGYASHGFSEEALELFNTMCGLGLHPTDITFIGVLCACAHAGLVSVGWAVFNAMKDYRIEPKVEHYGCMVNLLGRAGKLEEAYKLVNRMNIDGDSVLWRTLLSACTIHKNITMGEKIVELLIERGLANSGTYVLLSNLYASVGNWDGVARVRAMMKQIGVRKEPGCSSIEVNNKVHDFLAGDFKHPKCKEIYQRLKAINRGLKAHCYLPKTEVVLHDIGEEEKQKSLEVHSERLAIAFGLISTLPGTTIKIVKNLRACPDCHEVTKLISKMTGRKIVVRDRNRFHHFVDGSCSCGDYW